MTCTHAFTETCCPTCAREAAARLLIQRRGLRLDIGCGKNTQPGFTGIDMRPWPNVEIVWNLEEYPWPLPDASVVVAICSHVVEHIDPAHGGFLTFMDEIWRVMQPDGEIAIAYPHGSSQGYLQDPTHCNALNETTWAYFDPLHPTGFYRFYEPKPWQIKSLAWSPAGNVEVVLVKRRDDRSYHDE